MFNTSPYRKHSPPLNSKRIVTLALVVVVVVCCSCLPVTCDAHPHLATMEMDGGGSTSGCPFSKKKALEAHRDDDAHHHGGHSDHDDHDHKDAVGVADSHSHSHIHSPAVEVNTNSKSPVASWIRNVVLEGIWGMLAVSSSSSLRPTISTPTATTTPRTRESLVLEALCASGMTSLLPALLVLALPTITSSGGTGGAVWKTVLFRWMLSGGAGGLVGDVVFHTLPSLVQQSGLGAHGHHHTHTDDHYNNHDDHVTASTPIIGGSGSLLWIEVSSLTALHSFIAGIAVFYIIDCLLQSLHHHHHDGPDSGGSSGCNNSHTSSSFFSSSSTVVLLGMVGDVLHNFCDGLVIGAAFMSAAGDGGGGGAVAASATTAMSAGRHGWKTSVLIMVHEVPHECGDFALLLQAGWGRFSALGMQMVTALGSFCGVLLVYLADPSSEVMQGVLVPLASGSFIYLAISSMLGELKRSRVDLLLSQTTTKNNKIATTSTASSSLSSSLDRVKSMLLITFCTVGEVITFLLGAQVMWWILQVEDLWGTHAHHH